MKEKIDWKSESDDTIVCYCQKVNKKTIVSAIQNGAENIKDIQNATKAGLGKRCKELNPKGRCCHPDIAEILKIYEKNSSSDCCCCSNCS